MRIQKPHHSPPKRKNLKNKEMKNRYAMHTGWNNGENYHIPIPIRILRSARKTARGEPTAKKVSTWKRHWLIADIYCEITLEVKTNTNFFADSYFKLKLGVLDIWSITLSLLVRACIINFISSYGRLLS